MDLHQSNKLVLDQRGLRRTAAAALRLDRCLFPGHGWKIFSSQLSYEKDT